MDERTDGQTKQTDKKARDMRGRGKRAKQWGGSDKDGGRDTE